MEIIGFLAPVLAFGASIVAIIGNTWDAREKGLRRVTATGWAAIAIAVLGLGLSFLSAYDGIREQRARRQAAIDEIEIAWQGLVSPYRLLMWELDGYQSNPDIALLERVNNPDTLARLNEIDLWGEAPHYQGRWTENICGSAEHGYDELRRAQTIYVGIVDAELITRMKDVATDTMIQFMMTLQPCGDWEPSTEYPLRLESITNFRELPRYLDALIALKREIEGD
jgi:hypothetical protein